MKEKLFTPRYIYSVILLLIVHIGPYLLVSVISIFGKMLTGNDAYAGMMASVFALSGLAARFLSAFLIDRYPIKKVLIASELIMLTASFVYIFADNFVMAFILRGLQGFGYCISVTALSTYIVKIIPESRRLDGIGYSSLTGSVCNAVGPMIAFAVIGEKYDNFHTLFIIVFITTVLAVIGLLFVGKTNYSNTRDYNSVKISNIKFIILPLIISLIVGIAGTAPSSFLSLYAIEKNINGISFYFTMSVIGLFVSRFFLSAITSKLHEKRSLILFTSIIAICIFSIAVMINRYQLYATGIILGFAQGALSPLINTIILGRLPDNQAGMANAVLFATGDIGFIIGSTFWGFISQNIGYKIMFLFASVISAIALILSFCYKENLNNN